MHVVWKRLGLPKPTPIQNDIADFVQGGPKKRMIMAFRGIGKTWITAAYCCWRWYQDPTLRILVVSASEPHAKKVATFVKSLLFQMDFLAHLAPSSNKVERTSTLTFDIPGKVPDVQPSFEAKGITGQITGSRADLLISDDVEVPENSKTQDRRDTLQQKTNEYTAIRTEAGEGGRVAEIVYLGTPQSEDSVYRNLPSKGYAVRIWPARFPDAKWMKSQGHLLAPKVAHELEVDPSLAIGGGAEGLQGKPTDTRFNEARLQEDELEYARTGFALQFMLDTSLSDENKFPLKLRDLIVMNANPDKAPEHPIWSADPRYQWQTTDLETLGFQGDRFYRPASGLGGDEKWLDYTGSVMSIDPSGRGHDETSWAVVKMLNGFLYVLASGGTRKGYDDDTLRMLANTAKRFQVNRIITEANFGDGMFDKILTPHLRRIYPCTIEEVKHSIQKEKRIIDTLEPVMNQHRLCFDAQVVRDDTMDDKDVEMEHRDRYRLFYQMTRITKEKGSLVRDDRLDALAIAVNYWTQQMAEGVEMAIANRNQEELEEWHKNFEAHMSGRGFSREPNTFFNIP